MLTSSFIKSKAKEFGASVCGIGKVYQEENPQRDPKMILPNAKCIIGFGFAVPKGIYYAMKNQVQFYTYTTLGVRHLDEEFAEVFLLKMARIIENEGYDACLQRTVPNLRIKGDKETNPEVFDTYELIHAEAVEEGKAVPDIIIDFGKAAKACGLGEVGMYGHILAPKYGPMMRYCFIVTDAPLETDEEFAENLCDKCGKCVEACPGHAIRENGLDSWQCSVYYKGAHKSNPFMTDEFLKNNAKRDSIINGDAHFESESARELYEQMRFLPNTQNGYVACLCGKKCDIACYEHLKECGKI